MCCKECGRKRKIVNRKYGLCDECNYVRINNKTKLEKRIERVSLMRRESIIKSSLLNEVSVCGRRGCVKEVFSSGLCRSHFFKDVYKEKKQKKKTTQQAKEIKIKNTLSSLKKKAKEDAYLAGNECEGCLKRIFQTLDYSHILSVGQRKDLENDKDNKNMLCRSCHSKWESNNAEQMTSLACFNKNMKYIREKDTERFWKIYFILNDAMMFSECKMLEEIDNDYTKTIMK